MAASLIRGASRRKVRGRAIDAKDKGAPGNENPFDEQIWSFHLRLQAADLVMLEAELSNCGGLRMPKHIARPAAVSTAIARKAG